MDANIWIDGWIPWHIIHQPRWRMKVLKFSSIHPWYILGVLCGQYACDPLDWLPVQWCINLTHGYIGGLKGVLKPIWMIGVHGISHTNQGNSKKYASFYPSIHGPWYILGVLCGQYGCYMLLKLLEVD